MLRWNKYSGISPERRLALTFCGPNTDPLATDICEAEREEGDVADFPAHTTQQVSKVLTQSLYVSLLPTHPLKTISNHSSLAFISFFLS